MKSNIGRLLDMINARDYELSEADVANRKIRQVALNMQARFSVNSMLRICFAAWR